MRGRKRRTTEDFIALAKIKHGDKYIYSKTKYIGSHDPVTVTCSIHGDFTQMANSHLTGSGCKACSGLIIGKKLRMTTIVFIERSIKKHGNKYNYDESIYVNPYSKLKIKCHSHGVFMQTPSMHLHGQGCRKCSSTTGHIKRMEDGKHYSWSRSKYIELCDKVSGGMSSLYVIRMKKDNECFYKIGITNGGIKRRYSVSLPYDYEVLRIFTGDSAIIWDMEKDFHRKSKEFKYRPKIKFSGYTECFSKIPDSIFNILDSMV